jgi:hypothetical protein
VIGLLLAVEVPLAIEVPSAIGGGGVGRGGEVSAEAFSARKFTECASAVLLGMDAGGAMLE